MKNRDILRAAHAKRKALNVRAAGQHAIVLITATGDGRRLMAYLTSGSGKLRKAVSHESGGDAVAVSLADAATDFKSERKLALDRAALFAAAATGATHDWSTSGVCSLHAPLTPAIRSLRFRSGITAAGNPPDAQ